ncbi:MAG: hypothetical protein KAU14_02310 [Thermoplasmata archaeon]|nr:hypothetical protein [Thermoplasmata archaeon]
MTSSTQTQAVTPAQVKKLRERLNRTTRKLACIERSLKGMKERHELLLKELRLSTKAQREDARAEGGIITKFMGYIVDIKDILEIMKTTFQGLSNNDNIMGKKLIQFQEAFMKSNEKIMDTIERYRILSQLGELDSKILTLKFNGVPIDPNIPNGVLGLRSMILTEKKIPVQELQERSLKLFRQFAENIESAIESMSYKLETREILESMREVSWM